eukprot:c22826_g1_i1 orf=184-381(+)
MLRHGANFETKSFWPPRLSISWPHPIKCFNSLLSRSSVNSVPWQPASWLVFPPGHQEKKCVLAAI